MSAALSLRVETRLDELPRLDAAVEDFAQGQAWPPDLAFQVKLVLEELGVNIVNHAHDDGALHEIEIKIASAADMLTIEIADDGRPFDPLTEAPEPDLDSTIEDRPIGGLGIHLVRTMMDEARYRREEGKNHLTLVKRRDQ